MAESKAQPVRRVQVLAVPDVITASRALLLVQQVRREMMRPGLQTPLAMIHSSAPYAAHESRPRHLWTWMKTRRLRVIRGSCDHAIAAACLVSQPDRTCRIKWRLVMTICTVSPALPGMEPVAHKRLLPDFCIF